MFNKILIISLILSILLYFFLSKIKKIKNKKSIPISILSIIIFYIFIFIFINNGFDKKEICIIENPIPIPISKKKYYIPTKLPKIYL